MTRAKRLRHTSQHSDWTTHAELTPDSAVSYGYTTQLKVGVEHRIAFKTLVGMP